MYDPLMESCYMDLLNAYMSLKSKCRALEVTVLALQIQVAEAEGRADEEKHKRISLITRF